MVKYLEEYKKENINIDYLTIQNEPNATQSWESCRYTGSEERDMIKDYIFPAFKKNNIQSKLLIWDHNKERLIYRAQEIFEDSSVKDMVAGIGYHYYSGDHFENVKLFNEIYNSYKNYDEIEKTLYVELAEALYEKNNKKISIYVICPNSINIYVREFEIKSEADFTIKLAAIEENLSQIALDIIKSKLANGGILDLEDIEMLKIIPLSLCIIVSNILIFLLYFWTKHI